MPVSTGSAGGKGTKGRPPSSTKTYKPAPRGFKPVTVYTTPKAKASGIKSQQAINNINKAVGTKVVRATKNRAKADIKVRVQNKKIRTSQGHSSKIPQTRAQIESSQTIVTQKAQNRGTYKQPPGINQAMRKSLRPAFRKKAVKAQSNVITHELGHAVGLTHHEKVVKQVARGNVKKGKQRVLKSLMSGGMQLVDYDIRRIKKVTGLTKAARKQFAANKAAKAHRGR